MPQTSDSYLIPVRGRIELSHVRQRQTILKCCSLYLTVLCLSLVAQQEPTSQIVICFLFAQPLVCKLLSVNQATNYTAAAAEWNQGAA